MLRRLECRVLPFVLRLALLSKKQKALPSRNGRSPQIGETGAPRTGGANLPARGGGSPYIKIVNALLRLIWVVLNNVLRKNDCIRETISI